MSATEQLARRRTLGVELWADGDRLRVRAPTGVMTPELRAELAENKTELLEILSAPDPGPQRSPIEPMPRGGELPLSFAQERLWFLERLEPDSPAYNISLTVTVTGELDVAVLEQSFNEIVRRHEVLRTVCSTVSGYAVQRILPNLKLMIPVVDLRELERADREREVQHLAKEEMRRPFELAKGSLLRAPKS